MNPSTLIMLRPAHFHANEQTAPSNRFQQLDTADRELSTAALREFDGVADALDKRGIHLKTFSGNTTSALPDEIFANNWLSTHVDGTVCVYPMFAQNRRNERRQDIIDWYTRHRALP